MQLSFVIGVLPIIITFSLPVSALYKGADAGWVSQMESSGKAWYNSAGAKTDPFVLLKSKGVNAIRLRIWVNPSGGWNDGADVLYKAKRAAAQGQAIMVDFHYSDSWADPGQQTVPAAWKGHTLAQLNTDVYQHTTGILNYLKSNGVTVAWVQVGNEINGGMLWETAHTNSGTKNFDKLAQLVNSGYNAVKAVYANAPVILHLANGYNNAQFRWFFDALKNAGGKWDMIGMSHYLTTSNWQTLNSQINTNMKDMISRYGKPVVIAEVGMSWDQGATAKQMIVDLKNKVNALGSNGIGIFYWEPLAPPGWEGYQMGATDSSGKLTAAMDF